MPAKQNIVTDVDVLRTNTTAPSAHRPLGLQRVQSPELAEQDEIHSDPAGWSHRRPAIGTMLQVLRITGAGRPCGPLPVTNLIGAAGASWRDDRSASDLRFRIIMPYERRQ